jgi:hypothetical protein
MRKKETAKRKAYGSRKKPGTKGTKDEHEEAKNPAL